MSTWPDLIDLTDFCTLGDLRALGDLNLRPDLPLLLEPASLIWSSYLESLLNLSALVLDSRLTWSIKASWSSFMVAFLSSFHMGWDAEEPL